MANAEIRTLQFSQGVGVAIPPIAIDSLSKIPIANNDTTNTGIGYYLSQAMAVMIDYVIYRRTDAGFKWCTGRVIMVGVPDAILNADKWVVINPLRQDEVADVGVAFTLLEADVERSVLQVVANNMAGANHSCTMYYKVSTLLT